MSISRTMAQLTTENIKAARKKAEQRAATGVMERSYRVDWDLVNNDKRKGDVHAWKCDGKYMGQFTNHEKAIRNGAHVTRYAGIWFDWAKVSQ